MKYHKPSFLINLSALVRPVQIPAVLDGKSKLMRQQRKGILPKRVHLEIVCAVRLEANPVNISLNYRTIAVHFKIKKTYANIFINLERIGFVISAVSIRDFITGLVITRKSALDYAVKRPRDFYFLTVKRLLLWKRLHRRMKN